MRAVTIRHEYRDGIPSGERRTDLSYLNTGVEICFAALFALVESGDELPFVLRRCDEYFRAVEVELS